MTDFANIRQLVLAVPIACWIVLSAACESKAAIVLPTEAVTTVQVTPEAAVIMVGGTGQLTAVLRDAAGNVLTGRTVTWTSRNPAVATVSGAGLVTGMGLGAVGVFATSENRADTSMITVVGVQV